MVRQIAVGRGTAARWRARPRGAHAAFVDDRRALSIVCTPGRVSDVAVREVALATSEAWVRAALLDGPTGSEQRLRAVARLRETPFEAGVEWYLSKKIYGTSLKTLHVIYGRKVPAC